MKNRFTVPIAVAVAVHATLLFGFHSSPSVVKGRTTAKADPLPPPIEVEIEKPDVIEAAMSGCRLGDPDMSRLSLDDPPRELKLHDIAIVSAPPEPPTNLRNSRIDPLLYGGRTGSEDSLKFDPHGIVPATGLDNPPNARVRVSPDYPFGARNEGIEGEVVVEFLVDERGTVVNPIVTRSTNRLFEEPSLRAVSKWRFEPGKREGRIVRFRMSVPVVFRLGES
ncbi:MAG TPA: energy transducer TonB [Opitutaceae bacterium]|nr:energy transducer TonB [Opitutaceae bacterium]